MIMRVEVKSVYLFSLHSVIGDTGKIALLIDVWYL